jgi:hypothetical protein
LENLLFNLNIKFIKTGFEQRLHKEILHQLFKNKDYINSNGISPHQLLHEAGKKNSSKTPIKCFMKMQIKYLIKVNLN